MLLAQGQLLYAGAWAGALPYFEGLGYPCPMYKNPTDFFMKLASDANTVAALAAAFGRHNVRHGKGKVSFIGRGEGQGFLLAGREKRGLGLAGRDGDCTGREGWEGIFGLTGREVRITCVRLASDANTVVALAAALGNTR